MTRPSSVYYRRGAALDALWRDERFRALTATQQVALIYAVWVRAHVRDSRWVLARAEWAAGAGVTVATIEKLTRRCRASGLIVKVGSDRDDGGRQGAVHWRLADELVPGHQGGHTSGLEAIQSGCTSASRADVESPQSGCTSAPINEQELSNQNSEDVELCENCDGVHRLRPNGDAEPCACYSRQQRPLRRREVAP